MNVGEITVDAFILYILGHIEFVAVALVLIFKLVLGELRFKEWLL